MDTLTTEFLAYLRTERNVSPATIESYRKALTHFGVFLAARGAPEPRAEAVTVADVRAWLAAQMARAPATRAQRLTAIRSAFAFAVREGRLPANPAARVALPQVASRLPDVLSDADVARLVATTADATDRLAGRDGALLAVLYGAGVRAAELTGLAMRDVDAAAGTLRVFGKGRRERLIPVPAAVVLAISAYLPLRASLRAAAGAADGEPLFVTQYGRRMSRQAVAEAIKARARAAGLPGRIHLHAFRHTYGTHLRERGADLGDLADLMGHASTQTTRRYDHVSPARRRQTIARYHAWGA